MNLYMFILKNNIAKSNNKYNEKENPTVNETIVYKLLFWVDSHILGSLDLAKETQTSPKDNLEQDKPYLAMLIEGEMEDQLAPKTKNGCSSGAETVTYDNLLGMDNIGW